MFADEQSEDKSIMESIKYAEKKLNSKMATPVKLPSDGHSPVKYDTDIDALQTKVDAIVILTDDKRILDEVASFGGNCVIVTEECLNGSERIMRYLQTIDHRKYDIIVNIQYTYTVLLSMSPI